MKEKLLLVEGPQDKYFFEKLLKTISLKDVGIEILTPQEGSGIEQLKKEASELMPRLLSEDGPRRLGIVIDADTNFEKRRKEILDALKLADHQFTPPVRVTGKCGEISRGPIPDARVGFFIMPNHRSSGSIEKFFITTHDPHQRECLLSAYKSIKPHKCGHQLSGNKLTKAVVMTWLAWQAKPTSGYSGLHNILNKNHRRIQCLLTWLDQVFK